MVVLMKYICLIFFICYSTIVCIKLATKTNIESSTDIDISNDFRRINEDVNTSPDNNSAIATEPTSQGNVIQIIGGSDFVNATTFLNEAFTVLIEGYSENDGNWFFANKDELAEFITPIGIQDDGLSTKFIPDKYATDANEKVGTFEFDFKAIKPTTEAIELRFELKHPYDPIPIKTIDVNIIIQ